MKQLMEKIKLVLCNISYQLYKNKILKNKIRVSSIDETIDCMINSNKSLVRFGDGEISIIEGRAIKLQEYDDRLACRLSDILSYQNEEIIVGIPDIFDSLELYTKQSRKFWKIHLFFSRKTYEKYCNPGKIYANAFFSRLYYIFEDKESSAKWFRRIREIWKGKDIVLVEGEATHTGVGNDLLCDVGSIERILCPSLDAYLAYEQIKKACLKTEKEKLILLALGNTAKILTVDLAEAGYRVIDIGNLDLEYEWYLRGAERKIDIPKNKIIGKEENLKAGYGEYWNQVREVIKICGKE